MIATRPEHEDRKKLVHRGQNDVPPSSGAWMHAWASKVFPICRSITGEGLRATLESIQREIPIEIHHVPSGTPVLDWTIPDEWNIRDAWIKNSRGERVVDFRANNLHVVNYSTPIRGRMTMAQLRSHLHTLPDHPDWIPYRTSYYKREWGFCLSHRQLLQLDEGEYDVCIDASLKPGVLSYGELLIAGQTEDEFLISAHCCHPSLGNDNLSGVAVAMALARSLQERKQLRYSYRFLFVPGTIGAITWLARNESAVHHIRHGLVLTCVGDDGPFTYKKSRRGNTTIDAAMQEVLADSGAPHRVIDFSPYGYDERQYGSPGFNLPVGCFMRAQHGTFPEYHTSADNLAFIKPAALEESLETLLKVITTIEDGESGDSATTVAPKESVTPESPRFLNLKPKGEPQLGKYGVYEAVGGDVMPALWVLNLSDGLHSLAQIAIKSGVSFDKLAHAADILCTRGLLKEVEP
jgi:aminopeptidase-like protein